MKQQRKSRWPGLFRDLFLGTVALVILYQQVFIATAAQPLLIFLVIFLFASIPALRGDTKDGLSLLQTFVLKAMGVELPLPENQDGTKSSDDTQQRSERSASDSPSRSSPKSS
jgi:hypothetical protein